MEGQWQDISPFVRIAKIVKSMNLAGEWNDFDHVYTYMEQGEADFFLNGLKYEVKEGDVIVMPPFIPHVIHRTSRDPLIQYIFHFDLYFSEERSGWSPYAKDKMDKQYEEARSLSSVVPVVHLDPHERIELKRRFLLMHKEFSEKRAGYALYLKSLAIELIAIFLRKQSHIQAVEGKMTKGWAVLEKAIEYIHEACGNPAMDNEMISRRVQLSANHLSHLFKEQLGITLHKYVTHVRIEQAKKLMIEGTDTLTIIADKCGFSGIHAFSRAFKDNAGLTASEYIAVHSKSKR
ncbi:MAG: hypothetical protein K0Q59_5809 [Paenibacillus sp.]|nr:hypothetical protein [Paenibacillus sp.]